jgi:hypothetical protein
MQYELRAHLGEQHWEELQLMLAEIDGGRGGSVVYSVNQRIDAHQVQNATDLVATDLVPQMRARLARDLARQNLRPLTPWPAVRVRRYCWREPGGMRPAREDEEPDLYELELRTDAVRDTRTVEL